MRFLFAISFLYITVVSIGQLPVKREGLSAAQSFGPASQPGKVCPVSDLVLIYDGGLHRQPWTVEKMKPYIYRENSGKTEWLFDGFLFLEIFDNIKNVEYYPGYSKKSASKADWQSLLDTYFDDKKSLGALDLILKELAGRGEVPLRKRTVLISIPTAIKGFTEWGALNGRNLDFNNIEDQMAAEKWFIDEVLRRWESKKYRSVELLGFYWVDEDCNNYEEAIKQTKQYVSLKGKKFVWIPYWTAKGGDRWRELGFDFAYEQPNYFFNETIPYSRLDDACAFGRKYGLGMEMEFDRRVFQPLFRARFDDYVKAFTANNVWELYPVAYYEGGGAWGDMAKSNDADVKRIYNTLSDIIIRRQKKADESVVR